MSDTLSRITDELRKIESRADELRAAIKILREFEAISGSTSANGAPAFHPVPPSVDLESPKAARKPDAFRSDSKVDNPLRKTLAQHGLSQPNGAEAVLRYMREPLAVGDIVAIMIKHGYPNKGYPMLHKSLRGSLARMSKAGETFYRVSRGIYGLQDWRKKSAADLAGTDRPPKEGLLFS